MAATSDIFANTSTGVGTSARNTSLYPASKPTRVASFQTDRQTEHVSALVKDPARSKGPKAKAAAQKADDLVKDRAAACGKNNSRQEVGSAGARVASFGSAGARVTTKAHGRIDPGTRPLKEDTQVERVEQGLSELTVQGTTIDKSKTTKFSGSQHRLRHAPMTVHKSLSQGDSGSGDQAVYKPKRSSGTEGPDSLSKYPRVTSPLTVDEAGGVQHMLTKANPNGRGVKRVSSKTQRP